MRERLRQLEARPPVQVSPYLAAQALRLGAQLDDASGPEGLERASAMFRDLGTRYWLAVTQLELAERLIAAGDADAATPVLEVATATFEALGARPWLERARALSASAGPSVVLPALGATD